MDKIHGMKLHEKERNDENGFEIIRVPGGWIYMFSQIHQVIMPDGAWSENYLPTSVFVPFDAEFMGN